MESLGKGSDTPMQEFLSEESEESSEIEIADLDHLQLRHQANSCAPIPLGDGDRDSSSSNY